MGWLLVGVALASASACDERFDDLRKTGQEPPRRDAAVDAAPIDAAPPIDAGPDAAVQTDIDFTLTSPDWSGMVHLVGSVTFYAVANHTVFLGTGTITTGANTGQVRLTMTMPTKGTGSIVFGPSAPEATYSLEIMSTATPFNVTSASAPGVLTITQFGQVGQLVIGTFSAASQDVMLTAGVINVTRSPDQP